MDDNLLRKVKSAFYSSLLMPVIMCIVFIGSYEVLADFIILLIVFFCSLIGNFFYGIPVSILCDKLTRKFSKYRFLMSAFLHIFFAFITIILIKGLNIYAISCAFFFLLCEEWQKRNKSLIEVKQIVVNGISVVVIVVLAVSSSFLLFHLTEKSTKEYYLIPAGYVGEVTVIYNMKDEPKPKKIGDYNVININESGYGLTSLPPAKGIIDNKYYYIDKVGHKEKIKEKCIHIGSSGSTSGEDYEFFFSSFTVTNTGCTEHFSNYGSNYLEDHSLDIDEILQREGLVDFGW